MQGLIIIAHGSRREASNQEVAALAKKVTEEETCSFKKVGFAFLELAKPTLSESIAEQYNAGIRHITIFPYFLNSGVHMQKDIPALIEQAKKDYPECEFKLTECIGMYNDMPKLILDCIK